MSKKGWECPKCGRAYAPWVSECRPCNRAVVIYGPINIGPYRIPTTTPIEPWWSITPKRVWEYGDMCWSDSITGDVGDITIYDEAEDKGE